MMGFHAGSGSGAIAASMSANILRCIMRCSCSSCSTSACACGERLSSILTTTGPAIAPTAVKTSASEPEFLLALESIMTFIMAVCASRSTRARSLELEIMAVTTLTTPVTSGAAAARSKAGLLFCEARISARSVSSCDS